MAQRHRSSEVPLLLRVIDEAYEKKAWHGPNLRGSIRGVTARQAAWKPSPKRHSIWELVRHVTYWKYAVRRRLLNEKRGTFAVKGSNWFKAPSPANEEAWRKEVSLLSETHTSLRRAISGLTPRDLRKTPVGGMASTAKLIYGSAFHDVYHAGQIQLLKRLQNAR